MTTAAPDISAMNRRIAQLVRDNAPLVVYAQGPNWLIYHDDTGRVLHALDSDSIGAILTDPVYTNFEYVCEWEARAIPFDPDVDGAWIRALLRWYARWVTLAAVVTGRGPMWMFTHPHYLPFFMRFVTFIGWEPHQVEWMPPSEVLIGLGGVQAHAPIGDNVYGRGKSVPMLRRLAGALHLSDKPLLDPFMGDGSTLVAGVLEGWTTIGVECDEACCERAAKALEAGS